MCNTLRKHSSQTFSVLDPCQSQIFLLNGKVLHLFQLTEFHLRSNFCGCFYPLITEECHVYYLSATVLDISKWHTGLGNPVYVLDLILSTSSLFPKSKQSSI